MATYRAENTVFRSNLFAAGFEPAGEKRVSPPKGLSNKQGRSLLHKLFQKSAIREDMKKVMERSSADHWWCPNCGTVPNVIGFKSL